MSDKIKVEVTFTAQTTYSKIVEMTPKEFEFYNAELDRAQEDRETRERHQDFFEEFGFDLADPTDWDSPELDTFQEVILR